MNTITPEVIFSKIQVFAHELDAKNSGVKISESTTFVDLLMDDFDLIELIMILEEGFNIIVDDQDFTPKSRVADLIKHITTREVLI